MKLIQDQNHQMNPMNCSQSAQACLPKSATKIKTMMSFCQSVGSQMMVSPMRRTAPTSLKQFEANKKAIPAAFTASPRTGSAFCWMLQASKMFLAFSTNLRSSALATKSWEFCLSFSTCSLICGSMRAIELVAHQSFLMRSFNWSTGAAIDTTKSAAKITKSVLDICLMLKYELQSS